MIDGFCPSNRSYLSVISLSLTGTSVGFVIRFPLVQALIISVLNGFSIPSTTSNTANSVREVVTELSKFTLNGDCPVCS